MRHWVRLAFLLVALNLLAWFYPPADHLLHAALDSPAFALISPWLYFGLQIYTFPIAYPVVQTFDLFSINHLPELLFIPAWITAIFLSCIFWSLTVPFFLRFVGLWNPFHRTRGSRPRSLRIYVRIVVWFFHTFRFGRGPTDRFADLFEVLRWPYRDRDIFLGRPSIPWNLGSLNRPIGIPTTRHFVTIADTGAGKFVRVIAPNVCLHKGSAFIVDANGEIAAVTYARRGDGRGCVRGMGQKVYVLNPFGLSASSGLPEDTYNPFDELDDINRTNPLAAGTFAASMAEGLVKPQSKDPIWDNAPRDMLTALILYLLEQPQERHTLVHLRDLLVRGEAEEFNEAKRRGTFTKEGLSAFDYMLFKMQQAQSGPNQARIVNGAIIQKEMSDKFGADILAMARQHTNFLDNAQIRKVLKSSDLRLGDMKKRGITVYACLPIEDAKLAESRWLRMMILIFQTMMKKTEFVPKTPVLLLIDEFPNLGRMDALESSAAHLRKDGVRLWVIGQDLHQFRIAYPDHWNTFFGGAEAVQFFGVTETETTEWLAKRLGEHVVKEDSRLSGNERMAVTKLLTPNQIAEFLHKDKGNQIIWRKDEPPMRIKVANYYKYMPWWYYSKHPGFSEPWNRWIWRWGRSKPKARKKEEAIELPYQPHPYQPTVVPPPGPEQTVLDLGDLLKEKPARKPARRATTTKTAAPKSVPTNGQPKTEKDQKPERDPFEELDAMIGLAPVKEQVRKTVNLMRLQKEAEKQGLPKVTVSHHLVFTGNPGTGKTTVARLMGRMFRDVGILKKGHTVYVKRGDLVGMWQGETSKKSVAKMEEALDGVLFIDEAYSLVKQYHSTTDVGEEVVENLLIYMNDHADRLAVIAAGYKNQMDRFIQSNPGLKSRFTTEISFPDYSNEELCEIFVKTAKDHGRKMTPGASAKMSALMEGLRRGPGFGNGREVETYFKKTLERQADRLSRAKDKIDLSVIEADDIPEVIHGE